MTADKYHFQRYFAILASGFVLYISVIFVKKLLSLMTLTDHIKVASLFIRLLPLPVDSLSYLLL